MVDNITHREEVSNDIFVFFQHRKKGEYTPAQERRLLETAINTVADAATQFGTTYSNKTSGCSMFRDKTFSPLLQPLFLR